MIAYFLECKLGDNEQNLKYLSNSIKKQTNLKTLKLDLKSNDLGKNYQNLKYLGDIFKYLVNLE